jgi:hypothetical protein
MKAVLFLVALLFAGSNAVSTNKEQSVLAFKLTREGQFVPVNQTLTAVDTTAATSVVSVNGTPNNLQLDINDPVHLDLAGFFTSSSNSAVKYTCYSLPEGLTISKDGTVSGIASKAGQFLVYIYGDDGQASAVMSPFWIVVANEDGSIPSYVPASSPTRTATLSLSASVTPSATQSESPIPPSNPPEFLIPPKIVSFVPNFVSPVSAPVSIDVSDCFAYQPNIHFVIKGLPEGVKYDAKSGVITGAPSETGQWQVSVTATDGYSTAILPQFKFIVSNPDGNWASVPMKFSDSE